MKKLCLFILFLSISYSFLYSSDHDSLVLTPPHNYEQLWLDIREGNSNELSYLNYVESFLSILEIPYEKQNYRNEELVHSFGSSIIAQKSGSSQSHLILIFPTYSRSREDLERLILSLKLTQHLSEISSDANLSLLFLTGEDRNVHLGTEHYIENHNLISNDTAVIYLNGNCQSSIEVTTGGAGHVTPLWLTREFLEIFSDHQIYSTVDNTDLQIHRRGFSHENPYISPFLKKGIGAILIEDREIFSTVDNQYEVIRAIGEFYHYLDDFDRTGSSRNFLLLNWKNRPIFINETRILLFFILFFSMILLLVLFQYRKILLNIKRYKKKSWMIVLSVFLIFLFLLVSTLIMEELGFILSDNFIWHSLPMASFLFKVSLTFIFSSFFLFIIRGMPIPRSPHYYSYSAFLISFINLLFLSLFEITLTYFWIWTILLILLFTLIRPMVFKLIIMIIIPVPFLIALLNLGTGEYPLIYDFLLTSRLMGNFFTALNLSPYVLLLSSLHYHRYYYMKERSTIVGPISLLTAVALSVFLMGYFISTTQQIRQNQRWIEINEEMYLNQNRRVINLNSEVDMGNLTLDFPQREIELSNLGKTAQIELQPQPDWITFEMSNSLFLDRNYIDMILTPLADPFETEIILKSSEPFTIYECNYPFLMNPQGTEATLIIGRYPPTPLPLELTINRQGKIEMFCQFEYLDLPHDLQVNSDLETRVKGFTLIEQYTLY